MAWSTQKKWLPGARYADFGALCAELAFGSHQGLFAHGRYLNRAVMRNWSLVTVAFAFKCGVFVARLNPDFPAGRALTMQPGPHDVSADEDFADIEDRKQETAA